MIEKAVYELLKSKCDGRGYHLRAPQNATAPFFIFNQIDSEAYRSINNRSGLIKATFRIDVYSESSYESKRIGYEIMNILDAFDGTVAFGDNSPQDTIKISCATFQNDINLIDQTEEPFLYRNSATYTITYEE